MVLCVVDWATATFTRRQACQRGVRVHMTDSVLVGRHPVGICHNITLNLTSTLPRVVRPVVIWSILSLGLFSRVSKVLVCCFVCEGLLLLFPLVCRLIG